MFSSCIFQASISIYAVNMNHIEGDVVYCSQNAMFILPRKMLKILYQLYTSNAVYITPEDSLSVVHLKCDSQECGIMQVYVDAIKNLEAHNTFF